MIFTETRIKGAYIIEIEKIEDKRGFFGRSWCTNEFEEHGLNPNICQANVSFSKKKGTLRGMHYQKAPYQEVKIVQCTRGSIFDVIIDLRKNSPTYKEWIGVELTQDSYQMLYIPEDFAHGFITMEDHCVVSYLMTHLYTPGSAAGIRWNDPAFNIQWPFEPTILSEKDKSFPDFF